MNINAMLDESCQLPPIQSDLLLRKVSLQIAFCIRLKYAEGLIIKY